MQWRWLVTSPDGTLGIVASGRLEDLAVQGYDTPEKVKALVRARGLPAGAIEMADDWVPPTDRRFRDAWRPRGHGGVPHPESGEIEVDMPHARQIHRAYLRRKRITALAQLDIAWQRAEEDQDAAAKAQIAHEKRRWRDLPADPRIDAALTPDALWAVR